MKVKCISVDTYEQLEAEINDALEILSYNHSDIIDIKYQVDSYRDGTVSALIIYESEEDEEVN